MAFFITANIGRHVTVAETKRNIHRVRRSLHVPAFTFFQEIDEDDVANEHGLLRRAYHHDLFTWIGWETREPIAVPEPWRVVKEWNTRVHGGIPGVTPARSINHALVSRGDTYLALVGAHALNGREANDRNRHLWNAYFESLMGVADSYVQEGHPVVWAGDMNADGRMPRIHDREHRVVSAYNDFIGFIPAGGIPKFKGSGKIDLTIDGHNAHWARLGLV